MKKLKFPFTAFGSFLTLAVFLALGQTPAPAVSPVSHGDGDAEYYAPLPGIYWLRVSYNNASVFLRSNPDGTYWLHIVANKATVEIYDPSDPSGESAFSGIGKIETSESCSVGEDGVWWDGLTGNINVSAFLDDLTTTTVTESARFFLNGVLHDWTWVQGNLKFKPLDWDMRFHNDPFTWFLE